MNSYTLNSFTLRIRALRAPSGWIVTRRAFPLLLGMLLSVASLGAEQPDEARTNRDKRTIQALIQRIDRLEVRNAQLEARVTQLETAAGQEAPRAKLPQVPAEPGALPQAEDEAQAEPAEPERMDLSKTLLRMRGFGDVSFHGENRKGDTTSFSLGELNLFVTSDISEKFKFLSEIVFEAEGASNRFKAEPERLLVQYSYNNHLNLAAGRYHTAIGYYNTAYHHSTWFQTTTGRPFLFEFEDEGGILPIHNVGVSASGLIPSGRFGLHYVAEVGNGRASRSPLKTPVQNAVDENNHKAVNLALFSRLDAIPGLQLGFSAYRDVLAPLNAPRVGETILAAHAVYIDSTFEWLNEALVIRHAPQGSRVFDTPGFYTQLSRRFGSYRPYFRYQYVNGSDMEPVFPDVRLRHGPSAGLRYDASESVALKLQYDYTALRRQSAINGLALQVGFTF
jgi:hypothetical protein